MMSLQTIFLLSSFIYPQKIYASAETSLKKSIEDPYKNWVVAVHSSNPLVSLSKVELRRILLKQRLFWSENNRAVPLFLEPSHEKFNEFSRLFLGFNSSQYPRFWIEQKFTKGLTKPKEGDVSSLIKLIGILKGAIAVIPEKEWNKLERPSVKSIKLISNE